jgi:hypothetical protein
MVATIDSLQSFGLVRGLRPRFAIPSPQWIWGTPRHPLRAGVTLKNGAVTNSTLTTQDPWFEDVQVRTAYNPTDADTTRLRAVLTIEACRVLVSSSVFSALDGSVKDDATAQLFLEADVGGQIKRLDLRDGIREVAREFQVVSTAAGPLTHFLLRGEFVECPDGPWTIDLEVNSLALKSLNSVAYGADITQCWLEIIGSMVPKGSPGSTPYLPGQCGPTSMAIADIAILQRYALGVPALNAIARAPGT